MRSLSFDVTEVQQCLDAEERKRAASLSLVGWYGLIFRPVSVCVSILFARKVWYKGSQLLAHQFIFLFFLSQFNDPCLILEDCCFLVLVEGFLDSEKEQVRPERISCQLVRKGGPYTVVKSHSRCGTLLLLTVVTIVLGCQVACAIRVRGGVY